MLLLAVMLTLGAINALVPLLIIIILLVAAAGSTRGYSIFNLFGIATLAGLTSAAGKGGLGGKTSLTLGIYFQRFFGSGQVNLGGMILNRGRRAGIGPAARAAAGRGPGGGGPAGGGGGGAGGGPGGGRGGAPHAAVWAGRGGRPPPGKPPGGGIRGAAVNVGKKGVGVGFALTLPTAWMITRIPKAAKVLEKGTGKPLGKFGKKVIPDRLHSTIEEGLKVKIPKKGPVKFSFPTDFPSRLQGWAFKGRFNNLSADPTRSGYDSSWTVGARGRTLKVKGKEVVVPVGKIVKVMSFGQLDPGKPLKEGVGMPAEKDRPFRTHEGKSPDYITKEDLKYRGKKLAMTAAAAANPLAAAAVAGYRYRKRRKASQEESSES